MPFGRPSKTNAVIGAGLGVVLNSKFSAQDWGLRFPNGRLGNLHWQFGANR
jgi:hypothetical protein